MARTLIGQLVIKLSQAGAKETARTINSQLSSIENRAAALGKNNWGSRFQSQLDKLNLTPRQITAVRQSWDLLPHTINGALDRTKISQWKSSVLGHFATVETRAKHLKNILRDTFSGPIMAGLVGYGAYAAGRKASVSAGERDRAYFRMAQAGISEGEQKAYAERAEQLSIQYPGVSMTDIVEMALRARSTMGDQKRTLGLLEGLVQAQTVLMSARDPKSAASIIDKIVKAGDVLGQNVEGSEGVTNMLQIIDGLVRAAQIEGLDFNPGDILEFSRRGKLAGAAWSTEFISTIAPVLMQDQGGPQAGNALAMAFKAFVLGTNDVAGKVYKQRQVDLGLRESMEGDLKGKELMTENPFKWVQQYLVPALTGDGVELSDDGAITRAVGLLSRNTNATAALIRMLTQYDQMAKSQKLYRQAMGLNAAAEVGVKDPFVAWEGFKNSFANLAGSLAENMNIITPALNTMTGLINRFSAAVRENPLVALLGGGGLAGGGFIAARAIYGGLAALVTAGPSLQTAALMLQEAAGVQSSGFIDGKKDSKVGGVGLLRGGWSALTIGGGALAMDAFGKDIKANGAQAAMDAATRRGEAMNDVLLNGPMAPFFQSFESLNNWVHSGKNSGRSEFEQFRNSGGLWEGMNPDITSPIEAVGTEAEGAATKLDLLNKTVTPNVDLNSVLALVKLLREADGLLQKLSAFGGRGVRSQVEAMYSDYGVAP